jgi:hypothetical protein
MLQTQKCLHGFYEKLVKSDLLNVSQEKSIKKEEEVEKEETQHVASSSPSNLAWHKLKNQSGQLLGKLTVPLAALASFSLLSNVQFPDAYAHVSHVLSAQQYMQIKSGYPDMEIIAASLTGLIAISAIFVQTVYSKKNGGMIKV